MTEDSTRPVVVVAGASRGIGRALADHLSSTGHTVVAGCRAPDAVAEVERQLAPQGGTAVQLDVVDPVSVDQAAKVVEQRFGAVNRLVVCAGVTHQADAEPARSKGPLPSLSADAMTNVFEVNAVGTALVVQRFLPLIARSGAPGTIMCVSSHRGSIGLTDGPGSISYAMSKAALNMFVRKVSLWPDLGESVIFAVHPGWVATDLGGPEAPIAVADAGRSLAALLDEADRDLNGRFVTPDRTDVPW